MSGYGVVALDGIGLTAGQDDRATDLGFGAVGDGCSFGRGLKQIQNWLFRTNTFYFNQFRGVISSVFQVFLRPLNIQSVFYSVIQFYS